MGADATAERLIDRVMFRSPWSERKGSKSSWVQLRDSNLVKTWSVLDTEVVFILRRYCRLF